MRRIVLVFVGGFCGTLARYLLSAPLLALAVLVAHLPRDGFPYDILLINLTGALAMGVLYGLFEHGVALPADVRLTLGTGFLGAYTTFSTFAYGGDTLFLKGAPVVSLVYFALSLGGGIVCARLGISLAGSVTDRQRLARRARARLRAFNQQSARASESTYPRQNGQSRAPERQTPRQRYESRPREEVD